MRKGRLADETTFALGCCTEHRAADYWMVRLVIVTPAGMETVVPKPPVTMTVVPP